MALRTAILLSTLLHLLIFFVTLIPGLRSRVFARQGFAVEILSGSGASENANANATEKDQQGEKSKTEPGKKTNAGVFTGSISDLMNSIVYPAEAEAMQIQGSVEIETEIDSNGRARFAQIRKSSGFKILDNSARDAVLRWTFVDPPRTHMILPFRFRLDSDAKNK